VREKDFELVQFQDFGDVELVVIDFVPFKF
jgi:hypothetical protein